MHTRSIFVLGALLVLASACAESGRGQGFDDDDNGSTSTSSGGSQSDGTTSGGSCPAPQIQFNEVGCGDCVESACCTELQACDGSAECLDFIGCLQECTDVACDETCLLLHPVGSTEFLDLNECLDTGCVTECE